MTKYLEDRVCSRIEHTSMGFFASKTSMNYFKFLCVPFLLTQVEYHNLTLLQEIFEGRYPVSGYSVVTLAERGILLQRSSADLSNATLGFPTNTFGC